MYLLIHVQNSCGRMDNKLIALMPQGGGLHTYREVFSLSILTALESGATGMHLNINK